MTNREYYLTLPYQEKLKALRSAARADVQAFFIIARYYLDSSIEDGGLPSQTITREFKRGLNQKHFINKGKKTND